MELRVVSLVPSLTELVAWLGRGSWLAGRTRFCVEPPDVVARVPIVGGTKDPKVGKILALRPDLVLANKEENREEDVQALRDAGLEVLLTDPETVAEAVEMVEAIGARLDAEGPAAELAARTREEAGRGAASAVRVFVPIWKEPLMALGGGTYGHDLLRIAGGVNVLGALPRYPETTLEQVASLRPDIVLLPDEPYPFGPKHAEPFEAIAPVRLVDGKLLWWYGPRMPGAIRELRELFAGVAR